MADEIEKLPEVDPWKSQWDNSPPTAPGRTPTGQWRPGVSGNEAGYSRERRTLEATLSDLRTVAAQIFAEVLTPERWRGICVVQVTKALKGDQRAIEWCSQFAMPPTGAGVKMSLTPDGIRIEPIDNYRAGFAALAPSNEDENGDDQRE